MTRDEADDRSRDVQKVLTILSVASLLPVGLAWAGIELLGYGMGQDWDVGYPRLFLASLLLLMQLCALGMLTALTGGLLLCVHEVKQRRTRARGATTERVCF